METVPDTNGTVVTQSARKLILSGAIRIVRIASPGMVLIKRAFLGT